MKKTTFLIVSLIFSSNVIFNAQDIAIGDWRDHLSYKKGVAVAEGNGMAYCATEGGFFAFNKSDNSFERLSRINGFSSTGVAALGFNKYNNTLIITYKDANIDLLVNKKIINVPDIKRKLIPGNKVVNSIYFINQFAYLACGFGIVVFDTERQEVKDTYYIATGGSALNVRAVTSDGTFLYAATDNGIYRASLSEPLLANYAVWSKTTGLPSGIYNTIEFFNRKVITNLSNRIKSGVNNQDSIFIFDGSSWSYLPASLPPVRQITSKGSKLFLLTEQNILTLDTSYFSVANVYTYIIDGVQHPPFPWRMVVDDDTTFWIADTEYGLIKNFFTWGIEQHTPNGPNTGDVYSMSYEDGNLWSVPGGVDDSWGGSSNLEGISNFKDNTWVTLPIKQSIADMDSLRDLIAVVTDPRDGSHVFAGSWQGGVLEFKDGTLINVFNSLNTDGALTNQTSGYLLVGGVAFDGKNNLWVSNSGVTNILSVKKTNGTWQTFDFSEFVPGNGTAASVIVTQSGQKWVVLPRGGGILVYQDNGTFAAPSNTNTVKMTTEEGKGGLHNIDIYCAAEDLNGEVWVGTAEGPMVFYSPESIFGGSNWDARQVMIEQDGHTQVLLETEAITAIAIDGANRKWLGTSRSGVFLMSEDGTKQIYHFNEDNSPLFSNEIKNICIDQKTGEVFFGTAKGIISYKSTATEGGDIFADVYAYPNPVKQDYTGTIAVKGLVKDASVKITDISGNLIYSTKAEGGQAVWDGKGFNGKKAHTGTYLVYCSNEDGSRTYVTKIFIIN